MGSPRSPGRIPAEAASVCSTITLGEHTQTLLPDSDYSAQDRLFSQHGIKQTPQTQALLEQFLVVRQQLHTNALGVQHVFHQQLELQLQQDLQIMNGELQEKVALLEQEYQQELARRPKRAFDVQFTQLYESQILQWRAQLEEQQQELVAYCRHLLHTHEQNLARELLERMAGLEQEVPGGRKEGHMPPLR